MQSINPPTPEQLLYRGQEPLLKLEIYVDAAWVNLCALAGKNYIEGISVSLGGASMTPDPIGGALSASLSNENSIFHPKHPTSAYKDYLKTGRKVRASIGAKYGGTDYYWQRVIGFMNEPRFEVLDYKVNISGADYMKLLEDTELRSPENYWGADMTFNSISSTGLVGNELYTEADAMDTLNENFNVDNWTPQYCTFEAEVDGGGGSTCVGKAIMTTAGSASIKNNVVGNVEAGKEYKCTLKYKKAAGSDNRMMNVDIYQGTTYLGGTDILLLRNYTEVSFHFIAVSSGSIKVWFMFSDGSTNDEFRIDEISIKKFIPYYERYYELPAACKGPYRVLLDDEDVWQGEEDEGWYYAKDAEPGPDPPAHPARIVFFDPNKTVANGTNNLKIYYFTTQALENVVARILYFAGLYASEAAALADMDYTSPGINIDCVWFETGTTCLSAIKKICERCDYRFYFRYDGKPVFKPKPSPETTAFTFTDQKHIASFSDYQDQNEIRNRIIIEGMKQAEPVGKEETIPPELKGEVHNQASIDEYGERTLTIKNHLFQDQASIDAMCALLLAERKDPKWYADIEVPYNPVPLELGDRISWKERLSPTLEITQTGVIRDIKIDSFNTIYKCEVV